MSDESALTTSEPTPRGIMLLTAARRALAEAKTIDDLKSIRDQGHAALHWAKQQRDIGVDARNDAAEIVLRAERRLGEMLAEMPKQHGARPGDAGLHDVTPQTLEEFGIDKAQSSRWQAEALVSDEQFAAWIAETREAEQDLTSQGLVKMGKEIKSQERTARKAAALKAQAAEAEQNSKRPWTILHADCIEALPKLDERARLIFADPPYNIGVDYGDGADADRLPAGEYLEWCEQWLALAAEALADDGSLWVLVPDEWAARFVVTLDGLGLTRRNWIKWYETFGVNCENKFNRTSRHLLYYVANPKRFVFDPLAVSRPSDRQKKYADKRAAPGGKVWDDVWGIEPPIARLVGTSEERLPGFPTQLPLALLVPIIRCATEPGDLVVDPFCGSATTGAAAVQYGRRFIGIEREERWWAAAVERMEGVETK